MHNLTQRQVEILKSIIEEYIATAEPVGSVTLEKKYNLSASPATIRNEMVRLSTLGYIKKPHSSAGRVPTPLGMKFYVKELMKERELSTVEEVKLKEQVWDGREESYRCLRGVVRTLAQKTGTLAIVALDNGPIFVAGHANILNMPEFFDIRITQELLRALDEDEIFYNLFTQFPSDREVHVLLGEDLGSRLRGPYGLVYTRFETPLQAHGEVAVLGPVRLNYPNVVPTVRYFADLIHEVAKGW